MEDFSAMVIAHRQFGDAYIISLNRDSGQLHDCLDVLSYLPQQSVPVVIRLQIPTGDPWGNGSERLRLYRSRGVVSFTPQRAGLFASANGVRYHKFKVQPTLLFLCRAMVLFFQEAELDQTIVGLFLWAHDFG